MKSFVWPPQNRKRTPNIDNHKARVRTCCQKSRFLLLLQRLCDCWVGINYLLAHSSWFFPVFPVFTGTIPQTRHWELPEYMYMCVYKRVSMRYTYQCIYAYMCVCKRFSMTEYLQICIHYACTSGCMYEHDVNIYTYMYVYVYMYTFSLSDYLDSINSIKRSNNLFEMFRNRFYSLTTSTHG